MAKQDIKIYKVKSKEDFIKQREKDSGLKNIFFTEMKPEMSRDERLEMLIRALQKQKNRDGAVDAVSEKMIQAIDFIGSQSEVTQFVKSYIDAGVEHPILMPMPWGDDRKAVTKATMEAAISATQLD